MKFLLQLLFGKRFTAEPPIPLLRHYLDDFNSRKMARCSPNENY